MRIAISFCILAVIAGALASCTRVSAAADPEKEAVKATVDLYFRGDVTGDGSYWKRAFHPEAKLFWVKKKGSLAQKTSTEFAAGASGKPSPDEAKSVRTIHMIDITGDAAIAKVELSYPDARYVDYLSLLKLDGKWIIINKIFHRMPPVQGAARSR